MTARRPVPATTTTALPPLAAVSRARLAVPWLVGATAVLSAGAAVPREAPRCGSGRLDELSAHGDAVLERAGRMEVGASLREVGLAIGWVAHPGRTTIGTAVSAPGQMVAVQPDPVPPPHVAPPPPEPRELRLGDVAAVGPAPPTPPPAPPAVEPRLNQPPRGGRPRVTPTAPSTQPRPNASHARGGVQRVMPTPVD